MILSSYTVVGLVSLIVIGLALLGAAIWHPPVRRLDLPPAWRPRRFGYPIYSLIFLSFDMEMIFMYPWAVVFASIGPKSGWEPLPNG